MEPTALLALGEGNGGPGADATRAENSTAGRSAVGVAQAGTSDELLAGAVSNVLFTSGIGLKLRIATSRGGRGGVGIVVSVGGSRSRAPPDPLNPQPCLPWAKETAVPEQMPPEPRTAQQVEAQSASLRRTPADKLLAGAVSNVLITSGIGLKLRTATSGSGRRGAGVVIIRAGRGRGSAASGSVEATSLLALGEGNGGPGADTTRAENSTAGGSAVGVAQAGTSNELLAGAVSMFFSPAGSGLRGIGFGRANTDEATKGVVSDPRKAWAPSAFNLQAKVMVKAVKATILTNLDVGSSRECVS